MDFWASLIADGNFITLLIVVLILIVTGGVGVAIVQAISASRRGIKGDALVKEQNAINGLGTLTEGQQGFIDQLREEFATFKKETNDKIKDLEAKLEAEAYYNNLLVTQLINEKVVPVPRPNDH